MAEQQRPLITPELLTEGVRLGPVTYVVNPEKSELFSRSTGKGDLMSGKTAAPDDGLAPPTMNMRDFFMLLNATFNRQFAGIHAKHWTEFHAPIHPGQEVKAEGAITKTWTKNDRFYFLAEFDSRDANTGELLTKQGMTTILLQGVKP